MALIRNGCLDARGKHGGYAEQFSYIVSGNPRVVGSTPANAWNNNNAGGFGYVVSHLYDASVANGNDDSPIDGGNFGTYRTVFLGFNHAIHEFKLNYPRWGTANGTHVEYQVPVTIQWMVVTGHDNPLWIVTYDLSAVPSGAVQADSRAPYGDMQFDGTTDTSGGDVIGTVAWGETNKFSTTSGDVTFDSAWNWNSTNTFAAYNYLDTKTTDAEMGIAAVQTINKEDAGGYQGGVGRGATSADTADTCMASGGYTMPCDWVWPFQSINYSFSDDTSDTPSKRLAWGLDWYLGQASFTSINNNNAVVGWPYVSYSTYIVVGQKSTTPTLVAAAQAQTVDNTSIVANSGVTVTASGVAGIGRSDTVNYSPAGFDPVYAVWRLKSTGGAANFHVQVSGTATQALTNPVFVISGVSDASAPTSVSVGGVALTANSNTGYYASYDPVNQQVWVTLMKSFAPTTNLGVVIGL